MQVLYTLSSVPVQSAHVCKDVAIDSAPDLAFAASYRSLIAPLIIC